MISRAMFCFLIVSVIGLSIDISLSWTLTVVFSVPVTISAVVGFLTAAIGNYVLNEFWTFAQSGVASRMSAVRGGLFLLAVLVALIVRLSAVFMLKSVIDQTSFGTALTLFLAAGFSFVLTYLLSKFFIFKPKQAVETSRDNGA